MLTAVRLAGEKQYNGRAEKTIKRLRDLGLVTYEYTSREVGLVRGRYVDMYTVRPVSSNRSADLRKANP